MTTVLDFMCQLILSMAVGFTFSAAFANVLIARLEKREKKKTTPQPVKSK
ncbi:hypothetical protein MGCS36083_01964 [Streptococcus dysgalactiae subsp. equisimilis]|nr:hypothetical protein [Streptococcus dysgalactiae]WEQ78272.1 hypothetical protein MGCS36083_01964 [Streptococcus dysgalactiae subsp. equisimilis]